MHKLVKKNNLILLSLLLILSSCSSLFESFDNFLARNNFINTPNDQELRDDNYKKIIGNLKIYLDDVLITKNCRIVFYEPFNKRRRVMYLIFDGDIVLPVSNNEESLNVQQILCASRKENKYINYEFNSLKIFMHGKVNYLGNINIKFTSTKLIHDKYTDFDAFPWIYNLQVDFNERYKDSLIEKYKMTKSVDVRFELSEN